MSDIIERLKIPLCDYSVQSLQHINDERKEAAEEIDQLRLENETLKFWREEAKRLRSIVGKQNRFIDELINLKWKEAKE